jgi:transposase
MNAYSKDLRLKTLAAIDRGIPRKEVQELFGISLSTIKRWLKRRQAPHRGRRYPQDPRQTRGKGRGFEAVAAFSAEL